MIELYAKGTTDFSKHGIALAASQAAVTWQDNGRYDMDLTMPYNAQINIDYGMIVRCPVPVQDVAQITLGQVSYWEIAEGLSDVPLYSRLPTLKKVSYEQWTANRVVAVDLGGRIYAIGDKVSYLDKNYRMIALDPGTDRNYNHPPNNYPQYWEEISGTTGQAGKIAAELDAGDRIVRTGDYNSRYMKAADTAGHEGFIEISKCVDLSETGTRTVDAQHIEKQSFTITEITKSSDGKTLKISGEHISYQLGRTMLGECNISRANPATALLFIRGAMKEDYPGDVETNLTDEDALITGDFSWKNAQSAILDPKSGFLQATNGKIIRNDYNVYIIAEEDATPRYRITYGTNMKAVKWDGNVGELVTRVYPIAQNADGSTLLLPEEHIDTVRVVPYIRPEALNTGLKVGQEETQEDGTKVKLDQDTIYLRMREAAQNRFTIDECDKAVITLEVDWQHLPDTAEYAQYAALMDAGPGEWVEVKNAPLGISATIQMTGYTFDPIMMRYTKGTFGKKKVSSGVASYDIQSGAVTGRAIASGAVGSQNIMAGAITAREIEANSITSDRIASKSIITELLAAGCITADEISALAITAAKIAAGAINADKIDANDLAAINAKLGTATITNGYIDNAVISFADVMALTAESLIARDAVTDRYYIHKLAVENAQLAHATVGDLIVKASDDHYYKLDVNAQGGLTTTDVTNTLLPAEITAGVTSDGKSTIIETDLLVTDLSAANMKAINALIDKLTASRIDVQELFARQAFIGKLNTTDIESTANLSIKSGGSMQIKTGGTFTVQSGTFSIDSSGNVVITGTVTAGAGSKIGNWNIAANRIYSGSSTGYVAMDSDTSGTYAFWAGDETASSAPFRVKRNGEVTLTKLLALGSDGTETEVNLRTAGLWKLGYHTIKSYTSSNNYCTSITLSNNTTLNFNNAGSAVVLAGSWSGSTFTVSDTGGSGASLSETFAYDWDDVALDNPTVTINAFNSSHKATAWVTAQSIGSGNGTLYRFLVDASGEYTAGVTAANAAVTLTGSWSGNTFTVTNSANNHTSATTISFSPASDTINSFNSSHKATATVSATGVTGAMKTWTIDATSEIKASYMTQDAFDIVDNTYSVVSGSGANTVIGFRAYCNIKDPNNNLKQFVQYFQSFPTMIWGDAYSAGSTAGYDSGKSDWQPTGVSLGSYAGVGLMYYIYVSTGNPSPETFQIDLRSVFNSGWNQCLDAATQVTRYTRTATPYGGSGTTHYYKDGNNYVSCGTGWYQTTQANAYTLPARK